MRTAKEIRLYEQVPPNAEMTRLRAMLDGAGIEWDDNSDEIMCRTQRYDGDEMVFSAVNGEFAYGEIELWTRDMRIRKEDPVGLDSADDAFEMIREQVAR